MSEWLKRHPRIADLFAGIAVAAALALLVAEHFREKSESASSGAYYSQF